MNQDASHGSGQAVPDGLDSAPAEPGLPASASRGQIAAFCRNLSAGAKLLCLLPVMADRFDARPSQLILLVAAGLAVNFAAAFGFVGTAGYFNFSAAPSVVFGVLLVLLAGQAIGSIARDRRMALLIPVAVASASISLNVVANLVWLAFDSEWLGAESLSLTAYYLLFAWWSVATLLAVWRLSGVPSLLPPLAFASLFLLPSWYVPPGWLWESAYDAEVEAEQSTSPQAAVDESVLYSQPVLLRDALARIGRQRPGVQDLYFVGFAPYASQDVFMKEMESVHKVVAQRFDVGPRSIVLANNPALVASTPFATLSSLRLALAAVGERMDPAEDVLLLHVTTHGSESHELSVELPPWRLDPIRPQDLRTALDDARIRWRIVVVSACYSGGVVDALKNERTMVVTAADSQHASFGCGSDSDYTYFSRAFYEEGLRKTRSFAGAFDLARAAVTAREQREKLEPSNPQVFVGSAMAGKLSRWARVPERESR